MIIVIGIDIDIDIDIDIVLLCEHKKIIHCLFYCFCYDGCSVFCLCFVSVFG